MVGSMWIWAHGNSWAGLKGPTLSLVGVELELVTRPPMAYKALWRPLATGPCTAIRALVMAKDVVMPYGRSGLALVRTGVIRGLSWGAAKARSCLESLINIVKR